MPDWNEFYKNGLPREIIVIDDTPEPNSDDVYSQNTSYHAVPVSQLPPASATAPSSTKRKYDDLSSSQSSYQTAEESGSFLSQSASARNGHLEARSPDVASQTWVELPEPRVKDRRKRPRYEPPVEESEPAHPQPANIEYRGLSGPVRKAKEVAVRLARKVMPSD
jgi:dual-specificity kinase